MEHHEASPSRPCPACGAPLDLDVESCRPHRGDEASPFDQARVSGGYPLDREERERVERVAKAQLPSEDDEDGMATSGDGGIPPEGLALIVALAALACSLVALIGALT